MIENGLYYIDDSFFDIVRSLGGEWKDTKQRPVICLIKIEESDDIAWAVPLGKYEHRTERQKERIDKFLSCPDHDLRSCYYHIGRTTSKSIFFISDAVPISDKYISSEHKGADNKLFVVKNKTLISELRRKLFRILSMENSRPNYFRQHITDIKQYLLKER